VEIAVWISLTAGILGILAAVGRLVRWLVTLVSRPAPEQRDPGAISPTGPSTSTDLLRRGGGPSYTPTCFTIPFPQNPQFLGREEDLARLHLALQGDKPVGAMGITGLGGIGKTQLVIEYAYRHRNDYPDGIFWVDAAGDLVAGLARRAYQAGIGERAADLSNPRTQRVLAQQLLDWVQQNSRALLILDNIHDPGRINAPLLADSALSALPCRTLFTTRNASFDASLFRTQSLDVLPRQASVGLLLARRKPAAAQDPAECQVAGDICAMLGDLALAVHQAGAYLGKWSEVRLTDYRKSLEEKGLVETADSTPLRDHDLPTRHRVGVKLVLQESIAHMDPKGHGLKLLRVLAEFDENEMVPRPRAALAAGLTHESKDALPSDLSAAVEELRQTSLVDLLDEGTHLRLHPLVRDFAHGLTPKGQRDAWRREIARNFSAGLGDLQYVERRARVERGAHSVLEDCWRAQAFTPADSEEAELVRSLYGVLTREAPHLRDWHQSPTFVLQQIRNRAFEMGSFHIADQAERLLLNRKSAWWLRQVQPHEAEDPALQQILEGHTDWVSCVAFSPGGRLFASGSRDHTLRVWDVATGRERARLAGHYSWVMSVAFSPDGKTLASGSYDRTVRIWDLAHGREQVQLRGRSARVLSVAFSPDGQLLASGFHDGTIRVWEVASGRRRLQQKGHLSLVHGVAFSPDGQLLVSGGNDRRVRIWETARGRERMQLRGHTGYVLSVAFSPDGQRVASGSVDRTVRVWQVETGRELARLEGHWGDVWSVCFSPDGQFLASGSEDRTVRVWEVASGRERARLAGHAARVWAIAFSPDGQLITSGSVDETVRVWEVARSKEPMRQEEYAERLGGKIPPPSGEFLPSGSDDGMTQVREMESGQEPARFEGHGSVVESVVFSSDGHLLASGSRDHTVRVWDVASGRERARLAGHKESVYCVAFSRDGRLLASGSRDRTVAIWDLDSACQQSLLEGHDSEVESLAFSWDGRLLAAGCGRTLRVWEVASGRKRTQQRMRASPSRRMSVAFSPDGRILVCACGSYREPVWLLDAASGHVEARLEGHDSEVESLAFSWDGRLLAAGCGRTLRVWDVASGRQQLRLEGHAGDVVSVAFSPDGQLLASGSADKTVRVWDIARETEIARYVTVYDVSALWWPKDGPIVAADTGANTNRPHVYELELVSCSGESLSG